MPTIVPHRNIDPVLADIRKPGAPVKAPSYRAIVHLERSPAPRMRSRVETKRVALAVVTALAVGLGGGVWWSLSEVRRIAEQVHGSGDVVARNFIAALEALTEFKPGEAHALLAENARTMAVLEESLKGTEQLVLGAAGTVIPAVKSGTAILGGAASLNSQFLILADLLSDLQSNGLRYFQSDGQKLMALLGDIRTRLAEIEASTKQLKNSTAALRSTSGFIAALDDELGENYVKRAAELYQVQQFLDSFSELLRGEKVHLAVLFQNPSELRPGGGFIGSYADITVSKGQMVSLEVMDIYDPDGQLTLNVIPPTPLRTLTERWGARDANWFFDFPTSAKTVLGLLEASKIYTERGTVFQGALAVNIEILKTMLAATGPIALPDYDLTITPDNVLPEVQREVEAGADNKAGRPKRILTVLAPLILERLQELAPEQHKVLMEAFTGHFEKKDVMVYARHPALASFLASRGMDGAVYQAPHGFWGSYLAVVDANIAGGKSDAFVDQVIDARIDVDTDGGVLTDLSVTRAHRGEKEKDPWWRATNQNFIQIYTLSGSTLVGLSGNDTKTMISARSGGAEGFTANTDLDRIERTMTSLPSYQAWSLEAFGKQVFATWMNVAAGKKKTLEARYQTPDTTGKPVEAGRTFTFVFDRQSGVRTSLRVALLAPVGYQWAESGGSVFVIEEPDPSARIVQTLTLVKS